MGLVLDLDLDLDREAIQVIQEGPHRVCIQTGANDRMDLVVILDLDQTRVHRAISVEVVVVVIPVVAMQVAGITMVEVVIPVVAIPVAIPAAIPVAIPMVVIIREEVAIQEDI